MKYVTSYTAEDTNYPCFISIAEKQGKIKIRLREQGYTDEVGELEMSMDDFALFIIDAAEFMVSYAPSDPNQKKFDI